MTKDEAVQEALRMALEAIHSLDFYKDRYISYEYLKIERAESAVRRALKPKRIRKIKGI